ncbi:MAG: hypothetical protein SGBAC_003053 [Bacillariaceae sp.]
MASFEISKDDRRSIETAATEATESINCLPVNLVQIHSSMKLRAADVLMESETTDEETPASPTPSSDSNRRPISIYESGPFSAEEAAKAAYAIINGESVSEVDLNDASSINDPNSSSNVRNLSSNHSRSLGSVSALSEVPSDRVSVNSDGGRRYPSSLRILRSPDGRRLKKKIGQAIPTRHSFPSLEALNRSAHVDTSEELKSAPASPGGSLMSSPDRPTTPTRKPTQDEEERSASRKSYPSSVRILRTPDGKRRKRKVQGPIATRHSFVGVVTTTSDDATSPASQISCVSSRGALMKGTLSSRNLPEAPKLQNFKREKGVKFTSINVRYYERVVDINPSCSSGVAIGLGWKYNKCKKLSINEYETNKGGVRYHARQLLLPRNVREEIAREFGYTQKDIAKGTRANLKARNERKQTVDNLVMMGVEERMEGAKRKLKKQQAERLQSTPSMVAPRVVSQTANGRTPVPSQRRQLKKGREHGACTLIKEEDRVKDEA